MDTHQNSAQARTILPMSAMAVAGLVVGIVGLLGSAIPILNNVSFFIALLGVVFGIVGFVGVTRGKRRGKGLAIAAIVVSVVAVVVVLVTQSMYSAALDEVTADTSFSTAEQSTNTEVANENDNKTDNQNAATDQESPKYTLSEVALESPDPYSTYITGTFTNNTDSDFNFVNIQYTLFDKEGAQIGTVSDFTNALKAGGAWKFKAYVTVDAQDIQTYELSDVTYW